MWVPDGQLIAVYPTRWPCVVSGLQMPAFKLCPHCTSPSTTFRGNLQQGRKGLSIRSGETTLISASPAHGFPSMIFCLQSCPNSPSWEKLNLIWCCTSQPSKALKESLVNAQLKTSNLLPWPTNSSLLMPLQSEASLSLAYHSSRVSSTGPSCWPLPLKGKGRSPF